MPLTITAEQEAEDRKTLLRTAGQFWNGALSASRILIELDAQVAAHQETQAKLEEEYKLKSHFYFESEHKQKQLAETQAIARELAEALQETRQYSTKATAILAKYAKAKGVLSAI